MTGVTEAAVVPVHARPRLASVDLLRGLIMVIMALDHTREYVHAEAMLFPRSDTVVTTEAHRGAPIDSSDLRSMSLVRTWCVETSREAQLPVLGEARDEDTGPVRTTMSRARGAEPPVDGPGD